MARLSRRSVLVGLLVLSGCDPAHPEHKVSSRIETVGTCAPGITYRTVISGKGDALTEQNVQTPSEREFPDGLTDLRIDTFNTDGQICLQVQCQITVDGKVSVQHADKNHAICEWKQ